MPLKNKQLNSRQLIVFVKAPEPGKCKTRLIPFLDKFEASEFYKSLVISCFENIKSLKDIDIAIYTYPDKNHAFIKQMQSAYRADVFLQQGGNLGERMFHAINQSLDTYTETVLIGTDCPVLDSDYINQAFNALAQHDIVIGPAVDGGYVLIAARKVQYQLFEDIDWGTDTVLKQKLKNISSLDYTVHILNTLWDIDTPEDYIKYHKFSTTKNTGGTHE